MRRLLVLGLLAAGALALFAAVGCGKLSGALRPNAAPHTTLFVTGPVDTVNHIAHLYWFGTDVDGTVEGFEWRLLNPALPADNAWHFTTNSDSTFTVFTPAGYTNPVFEVRAIDDKGVRDPSPATQLFQFSNQPPTVRLVTKPNPNDTTFASVTVGWSSTDSDGDPSQLVYQVWLDGHETSPEITTAATLTMPSERFQVAGDYASGFRTLFVRAIDDGGLAGPPDSVRWFVRRPVAGPRARLLIVDEVPRTNSANTRFDTLYSNSVARVGLTTDQYTILRIDTTQPFKSPKDVEQTFRLFETVVWYRGNEITISTLLKNNEAGISAYLDAGGKFYLDGLYLFEGTNANGALTEGFAQQYLNCVGLIRAFTATTTFTDSTVGFGNQNPSHFMSQIQLPGVLARDSLYMRQVFPVRAGEAGGFRQFHVRRNSDVALWAAPLTLSPANPDSIPVGLSVPQTAGGRAVVLCVPLGGAVPAAGPGLTSGAAAMVLTNIYRQLGLDLP